MFRRRRYGTPLHPWARTKRFRLPRLPKGGDEWRTLLRQGSTWVRGGLAAFALWIAGSLLVGALTPPPLPDLAATENQLQVEGAVMPRLANWALSRPNPGLDRPWIYYAPVGQVGKPPATISIYAPVITERIAAITAEVGVGTLNREQYLERIIAGWVADTEDDTSIPTPTLSSITTGAADERIELATLLTFDTPFPWAPPVFVPSPSPSAGESTDPSASPSATPAPSASPSTDNGLGPIQILPLTGPATEASVIVKIAAYLPSASSFDAPGKQRMLVIALSYDASLPAETIKELEEGFALLIRSIEFP